METRVHQSSSSHIGLASQELTDCPILYEDYNA